MLSLVLAMTFLFMLSSCQKIEKEPETTTAVPTVKVTFPEGFTLLQIAERLEENGVCSAADFIEACKNVPEGYENLLGGITPENRIFMLEGYIFPDTYEFYVGENAKNALSRFLSNTKSKITQEYFDRADELGMTMNEVFTLASVIQSEASVSSEMPSVSAVFHNRLKRANNGFPYIGSDVTRQYIEAKMKAYIEENQLDYDALFGAYCTNDGYDLKIKGLPNGPVCNPGLSAIKAALYPTESEYLYFFTDKEGKFHYNTSYSAHQSQYNSYYR